MMQFSLTSFTSNHQILRTENEGVASKADKQSKQILLNG
jgi:hypothetical protein